MADNPETEPAREVTKLLADMDLLFSLSKSDREEYIWSFSFLDEPPQDSGRTKDAAAGASLNETSISILLSEAWLHVFHLRKLTSRKRLEASVLKALLMQNVTILAAKVGLLNENDQTSLWVGDQFPATLLSLDRLKLAVGSVLQGAREASKLLAPYLMPE